MYNWRLLLFAFFAFFQPIASFVERNLVDGRQQCCDHRFSRDTRFLYGNYPFKLSSETRRLNDHRGVSRDEFRNDNALVTRPPTDSTRDFREREIIKTSSEPMTRSSRTESRRMTSRDAIPEQRVRIIRDLHRNLVERVRVLDDSKSRQIRTSHASERRDIRDRENVANYDRRAVHQREERRLMPTNNAESRMFREMQTTRRINHELSQGNDRFVETGRILGQNARLERSNERDFSRRDESRLNQRSYRSLDRFSRTTGTRRLSSEGFRDQTEERRTVRENAKMDERNIIPNKIVREREDLSRKQSSQSKATQRFDNNRNTISRQRSEPRDSRVRLEITNDNRRNERQVARERMNSERFVPTRRVEVRRIELNRERRSELMTADRRNFDVLSRSRLEIRTRSMDTIRSAEQAERENSRIATSRLSRQLRETVAAERRQPSTDDRLRESSRLSRNQVRDAQSERQNVDSQRRYLRAYDESRKQRDDRELITRHDVRERATKSLEGERLIARRVVRVVLKVQRTVRGEVRKNVEMRFDVDGRRDYGERRLRERTYSENRLSSYRLAAKDMSRDRSFDRSRDVSRARNGIRQLIEKRVDIYRSDINEMNYNSNYSYVDNWQYLMYTLQAIYLCAIFLPLLMDKSNTNKKTMSMKWGAPFQKLIKVD